MPRPPILEYPGAGPAVIEPVRRAGTYGPVPECAVLCYFADELDRMHRAGQLRQVFTTGVEDELPVYRMGRGKNAVALCFPGIGAPRTAMTLEVLIGCGARRIVCCGSAGALVPGLEAGTIVVPDAALRDEGTSYHYQVRGRFSRPHAAALRAIKEACRERGAPFIVGKTWTTDGLFRETPRQVQRRRDEGCLVVEMEAAALFAVARFREVILGQLLYAGDDVSQETWNTRNWSQLTGPRQALLHLAIDSVRRIAG